MTEPVPISPIEAVDTEKAILSGMMQDDSAMAHALSHLRIEEFYDNRHQVLFRALSHWHQHEGGVIDLLALSDLLEGSGALEAAGGILYISEVATETYTSANIESHCRIVQDKAIARRAIDDSRHMIEELRSANGFGSSEIVAKYRRSAYERRGLDLGTTVDEMLDAEEALYREAEEKALQGLAYRGIDTGFAKLNHYINGICADEMTVLAADQSVGKTTLAIEISLAVARSGGAVCNFSLEMTKGQIGRVFVRLLGDLDPEQYRKGRLGQKESDERDAARHALQQMPITIYDEVPYRVAQIESTMRHRENRSHVDLWVIDYLQRIRMDDGDEREIGLITATLKQLSMELHTHILLLSQFSWRTRERTDRRPRMNDMKGSSSIEQDADNVVLIHRPGYFDEVIKSVEKKDGPGGVRELMRHAELIIGKSRHGPTGAEEIMWVPERAYFIDKPEII
jgi:replicative DNA helicase